MEYIFLNSDVLQSFVEQKLTPEYIRSIPNLIDEEIEEKTWNKLANNRYKSLTKKEIENCIIICHKYRINKQYNNLLKEYALRILTDDEYKIENKTKNKEQQFCSNILFDLISKILNA